MKAIRFIISGVILLSGRLLRAKEYDNILLYKNCGTWKNDAADILGRHLKTGG